jgi:hypothetical protein
LFGVVDVVFMFFQIKSRFLLQTTFLFKYERKSQQWKEACKKRYKQELQTCKLRINNISTTNNIILGKKTVEVKNSSKE